MISSLCRRCCPPPPWAEYLSSGWSRPRQEGQKSQKFKAQLWLCEDYPLSLQEQVMPIVDLLAISNTHFKKLKDFIHMQLPSGFPVKIGNNQKQPVEFLLSLLQKSPCST